MRFTDPTGSKLISVDKIQFYFHTAFDIDDFPAVIFSYRDYAVTIMCLPIVRYVHRGFTWKQKELSRFSKITKARAIELVGENSLMAGVKLFSSLFKSYKNT